MRVILILVVFGLSGCVNLPKTMNDFKNGEYAVKKLCSDKSIEKTHELLLNKLVQCYQSDSSTYIPTGNYAIALNMNTTVESYVLESGVRQLAMKVRANQNQFYQQLIEIKPGNHCSTDASVYELSSAWERHTARIKSWLVGEEVSGCGVW